MHQIQREICARWTENASALGKRVMPGSLDVLYKMRALNLRLGSIIFMFIGMDREHPMTHVCAVLCII